MVTGTSRLALWSCLLLLASTTTRALSVKARDDHWDDDSTDGWVDDDDDKIYDVQVGPNGQLVYDPPYVHASPGDTVRFHFNPKNHTVTQSSFENPCSGIDHGFKTGFIPVAPNTNPPPYKDFVVPKHHGKPLWFYCGQVNHCSSGMVFAINPPPAGQPNSFHDFQEKAKQSGAPPPTHKAPEQKTPTQHGRVHDVQVGPHGKLVYEPHNVHAKAGDTIRFHFNPKNHTVTQSSFENPCSGIDGGFRTGFVPVPAGTNPLPTKDFVVPHGDKPLWFYCGQVNHCSQGMVFSINAPHPPAHNSFEEFQRKAKHTAPAPAAPAPSETKHHGKTHDVQVGPGGKLVYEPAYVHAKAGDVVRFHFNPKNHTVTQSTFDAPCTGLAEGWGFRTGFVPVPAGTNPLPTKDFTVPDNNGAPLWFYCGQTGHCPAGMVFAINPPAPPSHNTFAVFQENAKATAGKATQNKPSNKDMEDVDVDVLDDTTSENNEIEAFGVSTSTESLKKLAVAGLALLGLNAMLALAAVVIGVLIYVKKNGASKVATVGAGRYTPVFDADKA